MAMALGPILLFAVIGGAILGGLDPRKKKKNGTPPPPLNGGNGNGGLPDEAADTAACAHTLDMSADGSQASIDGGPWISSDDPSIDIEYLALTQNRPMVAFVMCEPDPATLQAIDQLCVQRPDITFYGIYVHRMSNAQLRQEGEIQCAQMNMLAGFGVAAPIDANHVRAYAFRNIPELRLAPGGNIANVFANVLAAAAGAEDPRAEVWTRTELEEG